MNGIKALFDTLLFIIQLVFLARALISFFPQLAHHHNPTVRQIVRGLYDVTEPVLAPVRRMLPTSRDVPVDFSPTVVLLILYVIQQVFLR